MLPFPDLTGVAQYCCERSQKGRANISRFAFRTHAVLLFCWPGASLACSWPGCGPCLGCKWLPQLTRRKFLAPLGLGAGPDCLRQKSSAPQRGSVRSAPCWGGGYLPQLCCAPRLSAERRSWCFGSEPRSLGQAEGWGRRNRNRAFSGWFCLAGSCLLCRLWQPVVSWRCVELDARCLVEDLVVF